ncbi:hypothetical protein TWF718_010214 [Orbilia javanica]|uniref:Retrograde transport protein Dsl1 C-terminal domain-containing protein n=1 Tax=Orbilia javanica TaxID=47235 RepID=A0AAN8RDV6_9PEZI
MDRRGMVDGKEITQAVLQAVDGLFPESDEVSSAGLSPDYLPGILTSLQETIDNVKNEIKNIGESQQSEVTAWIQEARLLHTEISRDHGSLLEITNLELHGTKLDSKVYDLSSQRNLLRAEIAFNEELVSLLSSLKVVQDAVGEAQSSLDQGALDAACAQLEDAASLFEDFSLFDQILAVGLVKENIRLLRENIGGEVENCWTKLVVPSPTDSSITIQDSVGVGLGLVNGDCLVRVFDRLGVLKDRLDRLHYRVTTILIFPRLDHISGAGFTFSTNEDNTKVTLKQRLNPDPTVVSLYADLKVVLEFLTVKFGTQISHLLSKTLTPAILNTLMGSYLPSCIPTDLDHFNEFDTVLRETTSFEKYLARMGWLDRHGGELSDWVARAPRIWLNRRRESALDSLRRTFESGLGQRHRVERVERVQEPDIVVEAPKATDQGEDNWDTNWDVEIEDEEEEAKKPSPAPPEPTVSKQKSESNTMVDEDEDVSGWGFDDDIEIEDDEPADKPADKPADSSEPKPDLQNAEEEDNWGWGEDNDQPLDTPAVKTHGQKQETETKDITLRETYSITSIPQEVIAIIVNTIAEAEKLAQPQYSNLSIASSISGLLNVPASILTLYRALSSIFYRDDPNPAISIYNDCEWLEEHLAKLEKDVKGRSGPFASFDLQQSIKAISTFGRRAYWREMDSKRIILSDLMDGAQGFDHCTQYPYSENCETAVTSVIDTIQGIEMQWRDTLSRSALLQSIGSLLNTVVLKFINDIEDLGDISADASAKLASYISEFGRLESLFKIPDQPDDALPATAVYCEKWLKFQYLGNILDSSMVEIMDLWRDGALVDFEKDELIDLVKALFADGENRSKVLDELRRG